MSNAIAAHLEAAAKAADAAKASEAAIVAARAAADAHSKAAQTAADATHALGLASGDIQSVAQKVVSQAKGYAPYALAALGGALAGALAEVIVQFIK